jgi:hypothetical protein
MLPVLRMGVQGSLYRDNSNNMQQLQGTFLVETNFFDIYVTNYIFLSSNILSISLYITAWKLKNLNKSTILTSTVSINWIMKKKCCDNNFKNMGTKCTQFCRSRKFFCSIIQGLNKLSYHIYTTIMFLANTNISFSNLWSWLHLLI